jgi:hypothetical protein
MEEPSKIPKNISLNEGEQAIPYKRIGIKYYKMVMVYDRQGFVRYELKIWSKDAIIQDHGNEYLRSIPLYDGFLVKPSNINFEQVVGNSYNLYSKFNHIPKSGDWTWTGRLIKHVFGEQYELGLRYLQVLYQHPEKSTVILALVSSARGTGKTTFLNWLNALFGANMVFISSSDITGNFNSQYASKNIVAIEETLFGNRHVVDKLKGLATAKFIQVNEKFVPSYKIQCYVKIILTSNNEDNFAIVEAEEIRFLVRKLGKPEFENHAIEDYLIKEIPAFLHYLNSLPAVDWNVSRSGFTSEELKNSSLDAVVKESKSALYKDLWDRLNDYFNNTNQDFILAAPMDLKDRFFEKNYRIDSGYIRTILKNDFKIYPEINQRYLPFNKTESKVGRPYRFNRTDFVTM